MLFFLVFAFNEGPSSSGTLLLTNKVFKETMFVPPIGNKKAFPCQAQQFEKLERGGAVCCNRFAYLLFELLGWLKKQGISMIGGVVWSGGEKRILSNLNYHL